MEDILLGKATHENYGRSSSNPKYTFRDGAPDPLFKSRFNSTKRSSYQMDNRR